MPKNFQTLIKRFPNQNDLILLAVVIAGGLLLFSLLYHGLTTRRLSTQQDQKVATPTPLPSPTPIAYHPPTETQQAYVLALGSILSQMNNEDNLVLKSNLCRTCLVQILSNSWGITDRESAIKTLNWLKNEGHRGEIAAAFDQFKRYSISDNTKFAAFKKDILTFARQQSHDPQAIAFSLDFAWKHRNDLANKTLYAWDYGRLINVSRWAYTVGFIDEKEAWSYMVPAAKTLQTKYDSWEDYGNNYILGRAYWQQNLSSGANSQQKQIMKALLGSAPTSTWSLLDWKADLSWTAPAK